MPCQNAAHAHSNIQSLRPHICIAVHSSIPCIPKCPGIMSQLITGNYVIKLKGIASEFSCQRGVQQSALLWQPKVQVSAGADCLCCCLSLCLLSKSKSQIATTLAHFLAPAGDCTPRRGLLVAQALLQLTAGLAQQANSLSSVDMPLLTAHVYTASLYKLDISTTNDI